MLLAEPLASDVSLAPMTGQDAFYMRRAAGWSQQQMADLLEISKRTYERIERDEGREFKKTEQLMLLLWWRRLMDVLSFQLITDPTRGQWWIESTLAGKTWKALGPYETRLDATHVLRNLERLAK